MLGLMKDLRKIRGEAHWVWKNARILAADVEVDAGAAARWLPFALRPTRPARATVFVADYPETSFGCVYREAAVLLHARLGPLAVRFCPWMLVDDDVAQILGRELLGYPKKRGELALVNDPGGAAVAATVERKGTRLLTMTGKLGAPLAAPPPLFARRSANVWGVVGLALPRLLFFTPREQVLEARQVEVSLEVQPSAYDPLHELGIGRVERAALYHLHLTDGRLPPLPLLPVSPRFLVRNWALRFG